VFLTQLESTAKPVVQDSVKIAIEIRLTVLLISEWSALHLRASEDIFLPAFHRAVSSGRFTAFIVSTTISGQRNAFRLRVQKHAPAQPAFRIEELTLEGTFGASGVSNRPLCCQCRQAWKTRTGLRLPPLIHPKVTAMAYLRHVWTLRRLKLQKYHHASKSQGTLGGCG